jgi:hypothetical protein
MNGGIVAVADTSPILDRWKKYASKLVNILGDLYS